MSSRNLELLGTLACLEALNIRDPSLIWCDAKMDPGY